MAQPGANLLLRWIPGVFITPGTSLASVAGAVIEATARPDLEDFLRTRSPGEVITGRLSVRTSSEIMVVSILGRCDL